MKADPKLTKAVADLPVPDVILAATEPRLRSAALRGGTSPEDPFAQLMRADNRSVLADALRTLPELEYRVISLHFYDEMNNREIAAILDISEGYASRIRKRALDMLAAQLSPQLDGETV